MMTCLQEMDPRLAGIAAPTARARRMVEDSFIDLLGCALSDNRHPAAAARHRAARDLGDGPAPVLGTDLTLAPAQTALVKATAAHIAAVSG